MADEGGAVERIMVVVMVVAFVLAGYAILANSGPATEHVDASALLRPTGSSPGWLGPVGAATRTAAVQTADGNASYVYCVSLAFCTVFFTLPHPNLPGYVRAVHLFAWARKNASDAGALKIGFANAWCGPNDATLALTGAFANASVSYPPSAWAPCNVLAMLASGNTSLSLNGQVGLSPSVNVTVTMAGVVVDFTYLTPVANLAGLLLFALVAVAVVAVVSLAAWLTHHEREGE